MNTKQQSPNIPKGQSPAIKKLQLLTEAGWTFAQLTLFPSPEYNEDEVQAIKKEINCIYASSHNAYDCYMEFCQRMLLANDHYSSHYRQSVLGKNALSWLRSDTNGYITTKALYEKLLVGRKQDPSLKMQWKALAEAVLDMIEIYGEGYVAYWMRWFKNRHADRELNLFTRCLQLLGHDQGTYGELQTAATGSRERITEFEELTK